jgi:hypothetical protein
MYLSIDAITDVSKADSLIKAQEMGLLCMKYHLSKLYYKLFLTLLTDSGIFILGFRHTVYPYRLALACKCDLRFILYRSAKYPIAGKSIIDCKIYYHTVKENIASSNILS